MRKILTVPQYYKQFINKDVDLESNPSQCCPFHNEKTPSFKYNLATGRWRCFGACHTGGDVYDMHRMKYGLATREEAIESLDAILGNDPEIKDLLNFDTPYVSDLKIRKEYLYQTCVIHANCVERWLELDYVMSKYPVDEAELSDLLRKWGIDVKPVEE